MVTYDPQVDRHPQGYNASTNTPWGPAQVAYKYATGIINYSCAGHGGFHLSPKRNAQVDSTWRNDDGWYEEDCEWAIVVLTFPQAFNAEMLVSAVSSAKCWFPHQYEAVTGDAVAVMDSIVLQNEVFAAAHVNDYVTTAAFGSWADWVPDGKVGVCAKVGGRSGASDAPERWFLVDSERYAARDGANGSYVIDLDVDTPTTRH